VLHVPSEAQLQTRARNSHRVSPARARGRRRRPRGGGRWRTYARAARAGAPNKPAGSSYTPCRALRLAGGRVRSRARARWATQRPDVGREGSGGRRAGIAQRENGARRRRFRRRQITYRHARLCASSPGRGAVIELWARCASVLTAQRVPAPGGRHPRKSSSSTSWLTLFPAHPTATAAFQRYFSVSLSRS